MHRQEFDVDLRGLSDQDRLRVWRALVRLVADDIERLETDIPWSSVGEWPPEVVEAAHHLAGLATKRQRKPGYQTTGVLRDVDDEARKAFVAFSPFAYDAGAWAADYAMVVSAADSGSNLQVGLTAVHLAKVSAEMLPRLR